MQTNLRVAVDEIAEHPSIIGFRYGTLQNEVTDPGDMYHITFLIGASALHKVNSKMRLYLSIEPLKAGPGEHLR